jgi:catechol 2,3-dioxygenase-like lactoylglutathione lyase family enzyme
MSKANTNPIPDMKLELVPVSVSDIERARDFYVKKIGFKLDHDVQPGEMIRIVQLTPPGSACSIVLGTRLARFQAWSRNR